jgi:hypothetical protein
MRQRAADLAGTGRFLPSEAVGFAELVRISPATALESPPFLRRHRGKPFGTVGHIS